MKIERPTRLWRVESPNSHPTMYTHEASARGRVALLKEGGDTPTVFVAEVAWRELKS